jgi:TetR/AcrR family transcriptional regulator, cholesterol catabolism regulator
MTRRQHILIEAAKLFKAKGYSATSMRDLADKVGLEAASLYNHISSKEDILQEICFDIAGRYVAQLADIESNSDTSVAQLHALINLHVTMIAGNREEVYVCNNEWKHLTEPHLSRFKDIRKDYETRFLNIIKKGIEKGELQAVNPTTVLYTILSSIRWVEIWYQSGRGIAVEEIAKDIATVLLNGLQRENEIR